MANKNNDFWLWVILILAIPALVLAFFVGGLLEEMSLWDRAKIIVPITVVAIFIAVSKKN